MARRQTHRWLAVATPLEEDVLLLNSFSGVERLGRLFEFNLDLRSERPDLPFEELIGGNVTVRLQKEGDEPRFFNGHISRFVQTSADPSLSTYSATVVPWLWFLTRASDCRIFQNKTVPEIIKEVFRAHGFSDFKESLTGDYKPWEYCVQYRETDFNFVSRLMEQEGIYYFFTHENGKHTMVLADSVGAHATYPGYETFNYRPPGEGASQREAVTDWIVEKELQPGAVALTDFDFTSPRKSLEARAVVSRDHEASDYEVFDYPGEYDQSDEGSTYARARIEEWHSQYQIASATGDVRGVSAGFKFTLADHPRDDQNGEYQITSAAFHATAEAFGSGPESGGESFSCNFTAIPATQQYRPQRVTPRPIMQGPQTAIVVGPRGEEIHTDEHGRVRVHFHWDRQGNPDNGDCSCWIRVAQVWAGKKWGGMFIPRVGQEVIVEFLEGDPDRPIITGRVYNGDSKAPYDLPANKTVSTLKSLTSKGGGGDNELRFEDNKGHEQILLHAQRRMDHVVRASLFETIGGNREIRIGRDDAGDLNALVNRDINQHLKGGQFELVDKKLNQNVKEEVVEVYEKSQTTVVTDRMTLNAKEILAEGQQLISLKAGKFVAQGAQSANVKSGMVKIEGTTNACIKCGGSFIMLTPSGVFISGPTVFINSGGAGQPAEGPATAQDPTIETPLEAASATTAVPGHVTGTGGGGGAAAPRSRTPRVISILRAPEPPPPPPQGPRVPPPPGTDRQFIQIEWVEAETYCGGPATLRGTTRGYSDNSSETAEVRNVIDGATVVGVPITITGNAFNQNVEVKDWLPRRSGTNYETFRDEDAFAAGQKTPRPLKMKFIPSLDRTECTIGTSHFHMLVSNYECQVQGNITYVKGFMAWLIQLGSTVPAGTGGQTGVNWGPATPGSFSGSDWRFCKDDTSSPTGKVFWDGSAWQNVPAAWSDTGSVKLYGIGIWREGSSNKAQFGNTWPENIPTWGTAQQSVANSTLPTWTSNTNGAWTNKFDLRRDGCASTDQKCCRYSVRISVSFTAVATRSGHTIIIGVNNGRSNAGAWSLGDTRPGLAPHEFGHHLGNPDEYVGGVGIDTSVNTDGATAGIDPTSLMGSVPAGSIPPVKARHFNTIKQHLTAMIQAQKGVTWNFNALPHI
jgi:type VI secretion system secreted protein VgrG